MSDEERLPVVAGTALPPVRLANDARSRGAQEMVYVNTKGGSMSQWKVGLSLWAVPVLAVLLAALGAVTWVVPVAVGTMYAWLGWQLRLQMRGNTLALHFRFDEAETFVARLARSPVALPIYRSLARSTMAWIEAGRGNHEASLVWARRGSRFVLSRMAKTFCRLAEVNALVNLDRVADARVVFDRYLREEPTGDLIRNAWWQTELYLSLAEGKHSLAAEELHRRVREALVVTSGRSLIHLLAWAHEYVDDRDQAWHLVREGFEREEAERMATAFPRLHAWVEAHRAEALAAAPADDDLAAEIAEHEAAT
jgi:hypothetical protein